jgi:hypothetical protein
MKEASGRTEQARQHAEELRVRTDKLAKQVPVTQQDTAFAKRRLKRRTGVRKKRTGRPNVNTKRLRLLTSRWPTSTTNSPPPRPPTRVDTSRPRLVNDARLEKTAPPPSVTITVRRPNPDNTQTQSRCVRSDSKQLCSCAGTRRRGCRGRARSRAKARLFSLHARQLINDAGQLGEQTAVTVRQSELLLTDRADAAVDGPGSLLNYQGHPVERLTPDRDVTNPDAGAEGTVPESLASKTEDGHLIYHVGVTDSHTPELPAIPTRNRLPALPSPYPTSGLVNQTWDISFSKQPPRRGKPDVDLNPH